MKKTIHLYFLLFVAKLVSAQPTFPVNEISEPREGCYAFTNATIVKDDQNILQRATMVIREGKIVAVGTNVVIPKNAVVIDCKDKFIYPSFIDIYSDYGIAILQRPHSIYDPRIPPQLTSDTKGAYGWNRSIRPEINASELFSVDNIKAKSLREMGFGTVLTHRKDGIARGTGTVVTLANQKESLVVLKDKASAHYSFNKGSSPQGYPSSIMGSIALLRQTYLDAQWYKNNSSTEGVNLSLEAWNNTQNLPQIFDVLEKTNADQSTKWNVLRADRIGDEFGVQYIIKASGYEYQRMNEVAATKAAFILPLNFPQNMDVEDPNDARFVSLSDMKHIEMAPGNPAAFERANIPFCLTMSDLRDIKQFIPSLRKAFEYGLSEMKAVEALTKTPATLLGVYDKVGSLDIGKLANFIITSGPVFNEKTIIYQNWIQGNKYAIKEELWNNISGIYKLSIVSSAGSADYSLEVKNNNEAVVFNKDTLTTNFSFDGHVIKLNFSHLNKKRKSLTEVSTESYIRLSGINNGGIWQGNGEDTAGNKILWTATFAKSITPKTDLAKLKEIPKVGKITYPFGGYGWEEMPKQETILIKNATVWTNESEGKLESTDVLIKNGKIAAIGENLSDASAKVIDGTGKHVTAGIIDEHSHIAASSVNEISEQSVTSEVRIGDNLNPDDINIYRQLSGGVTVSHILHGSANSIGGQTQLIKLRWGANDDELKFKGADPFIKFALGENVKYTRTLDNKRFPDTRMGVEEVIADAFQKAKDYEKSLKEPNGKNVRKDLKLDALVEILNKKRFITCHSYVQSEIIALMRVANRYGFHINTFTHILGGYKVADKMKEENINASTFSDWWYYKAEVEDAIAYNAAIMQRVGLNVAINSDDAEMARRLNQEAAKSIKYGGMSEDDALKMVTLNPAKMLHISDRVGSIKIGKDADIVLWSDHPLSIYTKALKTIVDGIIYFDREKDLDLRRKITEERNRLIQKMIRAKKAGISTAPLVPSLEIEPDCGDHGLDQGLLITDDDTK